MTALQDTRDMIDRSENPEPDIAEAVTVDEAAHDLNVAPKTVRLWIREGAPCVQTGKPGPGNGARVNLEDLKAWRARRAGIEHGAEQVLEKVATALLDTLRRDGGSGMPAHQQLGIPTRNAAVYLSVAYWRIHRALTGEQPQGDYPEAIEALLQTAQIEPECSD